MEFIKYKNRKIYNTKLKYVTIDTIVNLAKTTPVKVIDNVTKEDITNKILAKGLANLQLNTDELLNIIGKVK